MVRDRGSHLGQISDSLLASHQPERHGEGQDGTGKNRDIDPFVGIHAQHADGHHRTHINRHSHPRLREKDVVQRLSVQIHQPDHHGGRRRDHREKASVGHHVPPECQ